MVKVFFISDDYLISVTNIDLTLNKVNHFLLYLSAPAVYSTYGYSPPGKTQIAQIALGNSK